MTEEDEKMIKEVVSDINSKAFYGKNKRIKEVAESVEGAEDGSLANLSPRSKEIAIIMKLIKKGIIICLTYYSV